MTTTPALEHLASVYLNEDWALDYTTWEAAVDAFVSESPEEVPLLPTEVARVLAALDLDEDLERYLFALGMAYDAEPHHGYRCWLREVASRVESATA